MARSVPAVPGIREGKEAPLPNGGDKITQKKTQQEQTRRKHAQREERLLKQENLFRDLFLNVAQIKGVQAKVHIMGGGEPYMLYIRPWRVAEPTVMDPNGPF